MDATLPPMRCFASLSAIFLLGQTLTAQALSTTRLKVLATQSLATLQSSVTTFAKRQDCFSCHHTGLPTLAFAVAREHGIPLNESAARAALVKAFTHTPDFRSIDRVLQANMVIDPALSEASGLIALHAAGLAPNLTTAIQARLIANHQREDGRWLTIDGRPPQSASIFAATALAIRAISAYLPPELASEKTARIAKGKAWLLTAKPTTTEDTTFRLAGLVWAGATPTEFRSAAEDLKSLQRADGGWGQIPRLATDPYSTGEALYALHEAGMPPTDTVWIGGLNWLLKNRAVDGTWRVRTRQISPAAVSPPYFESGFPYGHDQFLSAAATSYAVIALMNSLPNVASPAKPLPLDELRPGGEQTWMRTAIFGRLEDLKTALDNGLDPNSHTVDGTSLLMMASPDVPKMSLLIARGANVSSRAKSGYTPLLQTSLYRGSATALQLLLEKGASAASEAGVMFNANPMALAAYAGDAEAIRVLHSAGADANRKFALVGIFPSPPISLAVSLNEPEVIRALIAAGADVNVRDADSLTQLHFAALLNRPEAVQTLLAAGADLNAVDKFGYTPLLYASTVDFGEDNMVKLLLKAGAKRDMKAKTGETALSQAQRYHYSHIEDALNNR